MFGNVFYKEVIFLIIDILKAIFVFVIIGLNAKLIIKKRKECKPILINILTIIICVVIFAILCIFS